MAERESKLAFLRQSGWIAVATVLGGIFLTAVHVVASSQAGMSEAEYSVFVTLLRVQLLISIPAAGLQAMFARQTAATTSPVEKARLTATLRRVITAIIVLWIASLLVTQLGFPNLYHRLNLTNPVAIPLTLTVGLGFILLSVLRGVLTGRQNFWGLGWTFTVDGVVRFGAVALAMKLGHQATGGMAGVLAGSVISIALAAWWVRELPWRGREPIDWPVWLKRALPLALGPGVMVFMFSADVLFVQITFAKGQTHFYMPAATVGMALFMFLTPMAMVMFPKLVRSNVEGSDSQALQHALVGTAILGALAVLTLFLAPKLPLWVLYYKNPIYWQSDQLVSWYIAALYPLLLANILIGNLLAKEKLGAASCAALLLLAAGYAALLWGQSDALLKTTTQTTMDSHQFAPATQAAFQQIIKTFGASNLALLALSAALSWRVKTEKTIPPHSLSAEEEH